MRKAGAEAAQQDAAAGSPLWALSSVLLAGRLRMVAKWNPRASNNVGEADLSKRERMNLTRYNFRYTSTQVTRSNRQQV